MGPLSLAWCHLARHSVQQHSSLSASPLAEQGLEKWSLELLSCLTCVLFKGRWEGLRDRGRLWAKRPFNNPCQTLSASVPPQWSPGCPGHTLLLLTRRVQVEGPRDMAQSLSLAGLIRGPTFHRDLIQAGTQTAWLCGAPRGYGVSQHGGAWRCTCGDLTVSGGAHRGGRGRCGCRDFWPQTLTTHIPRKIAAAGLKNSFERMSC